MFLSLCRMGIRDADGHFLLSLLFPITLTCFNLMLLADGLTVLLQEARISYKTPVGVICFFHL